MAHFCESCQKTVDLLVVNGLWDGIDPVPCTSQECAGFAGSPDEEEEG